MRKGCTLIVKKIWSKYSQWRSFSESKPVPCTNSFRGKRLSILASCMSNLSKFHVVFSSSTLIRLNKGLLWERIVRPNTSSMSETLEYLEYLLLTNLAARRCTLSTLSLLYFWYGSQTVAPYSIKERIKEK